MRGFPAPTRLDTGGASLSVVEAGVGLPMVLCHGFADLGYSFRHQLPALAAAGFRAIAPDLRGAGASDLPAQVEAYDVRALTDDLVGLLDALGIARAIFVGHELGAKLAYQMALRHPDRVLGAAGLLMPFSAPPPMPPTALWEAALGEDFFVLAFQAEGRAEAALEADLDRTLRYLFRTAQGSSPGERRPFEVEGFALLTELAGAESRWGGRPLLTPEEHAVYREAFARTGFAPTLAWYRNVDRNWALSRQLPERLDVPTLLVTAEHEVMVPAERAEGMEAVCEDVRVVHVRDAGHWVHQEQPAEVNRALVQWARARWGRDAPWGQEEG